MGGVHPLYAEYIESIKAITNRDFKTIIDVGANNGWYSEACHYYFPNAKIYSFEPVPIKYNKIKQLPFINAFYYGLWDKNDKAVFHIPREEELDDGSSFLKVGKENYIHNIKEHKGCYNIKIERKRFDSLNIEIVRPCLSKIDTEGSEIYVLRGFGDKLREVDAIQLEVSFQENFKRQTKLSELISHLEKFGFLGFIQKSLRVHDDYPNHCDLIFFRKDDKKKIYSKMV